MEVPSILVLVAYVLTTLLETFVTNASLDGVELSYWLNRLDLSRLDQNTVKANVV